MTSRFFLGNFDFEHELADPSGWRASRHVQRLLAERASAWIALADDGDWIWTPEPITESFWDELAAAGLPRVHGVTCFDKPSTTDIKLVPWGWTTRLAGLASSWSSKQGEAVSSDGRPPDLNAVRLGNSREWAFQVECRLNVALPGAARLEQLSDLASFVERSARLFGELPDKHAWVIKANYGMSGRERILGRGSRLSEPQQRWLQRRLASDHAVFFEPWLIILAEAGLQWDVPQLGFGEPKLLGVTPLLCDSQGVYRGSRIAWETNIPTEWQFAVEPGQHVTGQLQQLGYVGPVGIDAAIYETPNGQRIVRPLQDINARFTLGRVALGFRRWLQPDEQAVWWHVTQEDDVAKKLPHDARVIRTSPARIGEQPAQHQSLLVIAKSMSTSTL